MYVISETFSVKTFSEQAVKTQLFSIGTGHLPPIDLRPRPNLVVFARLAIHVFV